ncbi:hypothetical protein B4100_1861 [Heyndrickxia coagulans]|nr:hypothetical protein B4100_1861 [Heyndrickxia coagulans]
MFLIVYRLVPECKEKLDSVNTSGDYFRGEIVRNAILNGKTVRIIFMHSK